MNPFLAEIRLLPFSFAPRGWALCQGQIMSISQNTALFSLLGTTYGGNGTSNFALPNLNGAIAVGQGQGSGLTAYGLGETGGAPTITLLTTQMPAHRHGLNAFVGRDASATGTPSIGAALTASEGGQLYAASAANQMSPTVLALAGGSLPHNNLMPYLGLNFCIALQGIYPARN